MVAEHRNFTRAAEALFISQPALSKQIRMLENQLRTTLFVRNRRSVELTGAGESLLRHATRLLQMWDAAQSDLAAATAAQNATLVVGFSTGIGRGLLPVVRARLAEQIPDVALRMRQVPWDDPTGGLTGHGADRTDAAFVWLPLPDTGRYRWLEVATEPRMVALRADHVLAGSTDIDFADLLDEPFIALPKSSGALRDYWLALDARHGRRVLIGAEVSSTDETVEALLAGLGVCLVSTGNVPLLAGDGVVIRPVTGLAPSRLVFAWRHDDHRPLLEALRRAVEAAVSAVASRGADAPSPAE